jgi:chromate reductase
MQMKTILAISGSTRLHSSNHQLIKAIVDLLKEKCNVVIYKELSNLPHFNPDNDNENAPQSIIDLRTLLNTADGVLICTPEYAHGVPGTLKNAIDWTVSSANFSNKPTVLITASTDGQFGHKALLETLKIIEAKNIENLQLIVPFIKTKLNADHKIIHENTLFEINKLMDDFIKTINAD